MNDTPTKEKPRLQRFRRGMYDNTADEATTAEAMHRKELALSFAGIGEDKFVHHTFLSLNHQIITTDIPTMAVTMFADGDRAFLMNPHFACSLDDPRADMLKIFQHECLHLLLKHLQRDPELRADQTWTYACEVVINAVMLAWSADKRMPHARREDKNGNIKVEPTGIDPRKVHADYVKKCEEAGLTSVSYDKFVESEHSCYTELKRLPDPPGSPNNPVKAVCPHQDGDLGDGEGTGESQDQDQIDDVVRQAIQGTVTDARRGSERARDQILKLADITEDGNEHAKKMWGSYGLMGVRGQTDATRKVEWWLQWLGNMVATRLSDGEKLDYPKKRSGMLLALGFDPTPVRRGNVLKRRGAAFLDTSLSMPSNVVDDITKLVGQIPDTEMDWYMFDGIVERLIPGEVVKGGGGTNFQNCVDVAEGRLEVNGELTDGDYDFVIMLTDGGAPPVAPAEPDKWIWLITKGGDEWPETHTPAMDCHVIDTAEAADEAG